MDSKMIPSKFLIFSLFYFAVSAQDFMGFRIPRGSYMGSFNQNYPYGGSYLPQNFYNPYQNQNWQYQYQYQNQNQWTSNPWNQNEVYRQSGYGRPVSSYSPPSTLPQQPQASSYGRPMSAYGPSPPPQPKKSSYGRPEIFNEPSVISSTFQPVIIPSQAPPIPQMETGRIESSIDDYTTSIPIQPPQPPQPSIDQPLFGGVQPGAGTIPPLPPTDEEMTRVDAAEKENEVRKARKMGPPGISIDSVIETGTLPPQAAVAEIPQPPPSSR